MLLSEQLQQADVSGDFGRALEGYADRARQLEAWLEYCLTNGRYSPDYNFGMLATNTMLKLLDGESVELPENIKEE